MIKRTWPTERELDAASTCIHEKSQECHLVDFVTQDGHCYSFPMTHLVYCVLEPNPSAEDEPEAPPDRLSLAFATQDVVLLGWNLQVVRDAFDLGRPVVLRARDARYAKIENRQPFVSAISVRTDEQRTDTAKK
jgi:hypothetical protein